MKLNALKTGAWSLVRGRASESLEERNARNLILSGAWLGFIDGGILTYLGVWLARTGATPTMMGILSSAPQLVNMLAVVPAGAFVERQKNLVQLANRAAVSHRLGYVLIAALPFLVPVAYVPTAAILVWALIAIPGAAHFPALMAVIHQAVPPQMRPRANAYRWALYCAVATVAIPAFGTMIDHMPFPVGYQIAFTLSFVGSLPNLYFFGKVALPPFSRQIEENTAPASARARLRNFLTPFLESKSFVRFNLAVAVYRVTLSMPAGLFSIFWVDHLHASDTLIGLRGAVAYGSLVVGYWLWAKVTNRVGHRTILFISSLIGLYTILTALSPGAIWLIPVAMVWGLTVAALDIGIVDMLLLACPEGRQPTFSAVSNLLASVELTVGPLIGAALAESIGVPEALLVSGALEILSSVFFFLLPNREEEMRLHTVPQPGPPSTV